MNHSIIKSQRVRVERAAEAPRRSEARRACQPTSEKRARLLRENGVVTAIELVCACGETTVVELEYDSPSEPTP